jgi:hypothetical protein
VGQGCDGEIFGNHETKEIMDNALITMVFLQDSGSLGKQEKVFRNFRCFFYWHLLEVQLECKLVLDSRIKSLISKGFLKISIRRGS